MVENHPTCAKTLKDKSQHLCVDENLNTQRTRTIIYSLDFTFIHVLYCLVMMSNWGKQT